MHQMNVTGCVKVHIPHMRIISESMAHTRKLTVTKYYVCSKNILLKCQSPQMYYLYSINVYDIQKRPNFES